MDTYDLKLWDPYYIRLPQDIARGHTPGRECVCGLSVVYDSERSNWRSLGQKFDRWIIMRLWEAWLLRSLLWFIYRLCISSSHNAANEALQRERCMWQVRMDYSGPVRSIFNQTWILPSTAHGSAEQTSHSSHCKRRFNTVKDTGRKKQQRHREIRMLSYRCSVWVWSCPSHQMGFCHREKARFRL